MAIALRRLLDPFLGDSFPFATLFFAIILMAWAWGGWSALTTAWVGGIAADYFLLSPHGSFALERKDIIGLLLYLITGLGTASLGGMMHRARQRAETSANALRASNDLLEARVQARSAELEQKNQILESEAASRRIREDRLKLLETCLNRLNDIVLITEAEPLHEHGPRIIYVNDAFVRRTGFTREEAIGMTPRMLQGPKTDRQELGRIHEALRLWQPVRAELINYTKSGREFWLELDILPVADPGGWFTHWVAVERDITERKLAEGKAALLASIVQHSDDAIIGKNLDGIVTSWNLGAERIFGYRADEMVGQPILQLIPGERQHEEDDILARVRIGESIRHFDTVRQHKDGRRLEVSLTVSPIKDSDDNILGVSKIVRDVSERNRISKILLESEARLQLALQAGEMGTFEINLATGEAFWNTVEYQLLGLKPGEESPGPETFFRFVHPEDVETVREAWAEGLRTGEFASEFRVRHRDGKERWLAGRGRFAFLEEDKSRPASRFLGINFDVTDRIGAQQIMRESAERMRLANEATGVGIWEWNLATNEVRWDAQMFRIYGVDPTPDGFVQYELWRKAVLPEDLKPQEAILQETIRQFGSSNREFRIIRYNDGECRSIQAVERVSINKQGRAGWLVGTNLDITERKQLEAEIRESEERFRTLANSMPQLAWIGRADGFISWYNQRWYEYTGTTPEQMEGWGWQIVHDPGMLPRVLEQWQVAIQSGDAFEMEFPIRRSDGHYRTFLTRGHPIKDATGRVIQWFGTNTDVDELKQAEEKIRQLNTNLELRVVDRTAQLETANKELEAFCYSVSHDLRAPLRAINGFAGMVLSEYAGQLPAEGKRYLNRIHEGGVRMGVLIDDLLAFSRLNRQPVKFQKVDAGQLVQVVLKELEPEREGRQIEIQIGNLPPCHADSPLLKQVWINLLSNAIKYTRGRSPARIEIGCTFEDGEVVYFVRDNGVGFDMQFVNKLFGVFQRLHRADEFEGTGVGLAIVQRVIHRHGGRVWATAELENGATFHFTLEQKRTL